MEKKYLKPAEITKEVIDGWKNQYEKVVKYATEDGKVAYFRNPDLKTADAAAAIASTSPIKSMIIAKNCFLGGDEEVITDEKYIFGLGNHLRALIVKVEGELSEL